MYSRGQELHRELDTTFHADGVLEEEHQQGVLRRLLRVQHEAAREAFARGQIGHSVLRQLTVDIDAELGGGTIADRGSSTGQGTFGFNARYNKQGAPKGQMMYSWEGIYGGQAATFTIASNALSSLSCSGGTTAVPAITATLQGKCSYSIVSRATGAALYSEGNDSFSATVIDGDSGQGGQTSAADRFALSTFQGGNIALHPVSGTLTGGNVVAHTK